MSAFLSAFIGVHRRPIMFFRLLRATLDEIFDQSAYRRHLTSHGLAHSGEAWRHFQDHHLSAKSRRARCC